MGLPFWRIPDRGEVWKSNTDWKLGACSLNIEDFQNEKISGFSFICRSHVCDLGE
jgi:hypothetical protein